MTSDHSGQGGKHNLYEDLIIIESYLAFKGRNCALIAADEIRRKLKRNRTEQQIGRRATLLGLTKTRSRFFWSEAEDAWVRSHMHLSFEQLHREFSQKFGRRSLSAIVARVGRLGVRATRSENGFTAKQLAAHLHLDISLLVQRGYLRGVRPTGRDWYFSNQEVRRFIIANPEMIDMTRVSKFWLIDLLGTRTGDPMSSDSLTGNI